MFEIQWAAEKKKQQQRWFGLNEIAQNGIVVTF